MSALDPWRVLAAILVVGGLCGAGIGGLEFASTVEANSDDYTMSIHALDGDDAVPVQDSDDAGPNNTTITDYGNLAADAQEAFDELYDGSDNSVTPIPEERARHLNETTELTLHDRITVRYQGSIYWFWLGERAERSTVGQLAIVGGLLVGSPVVVAMLGVLLYIRRRDN
ncbi:hypothetical protein [Natrinema salaciae]|uniref:DUF7979 domain-containing protein n=1 Tax=Natrinema salaciae TaxID=1186196 RepID=A0A1H9R379_9EURY|nr:hypothetical protein [Natrinema salaciae]SER66433.1 hypothetical protein SAMN04489841_4241 [Natrinema salaciae]